MGGQKSDEGIKKLTSPASGVIEAKVGLTWMSGQDGLLRWISELAARAPLRNVGPRLIVMLENLQRKKKYSQVIQRCHFGAMRNVLTMKGPKHQK